MNKENRWFNYCPASRGSITEGLESCVSIKKKNDMPDVLNLMRTCSVTQSYFSRT